MRENLFLRAVLSAVAVSLLFYAAGYAVVGLWQISYCATEGISAAELSEHMEEYSAYAARMATYMNIVMAGIALFVASLYFTLKKRSPLREMGVRRGRGPHIAGAALMGAGFQIPLGHILDLVPFPEETVQRHEELLNASASPVAVQVFYAVVLAPVAEELLFRGIVHKRFSEALPVLPATVFSATVFGFAHGELLSVVGAVLCGIILALVFGRAETVLAPMAFHIAFNAVGYVAKSGYIPSGAADTVITAVSIILFILGAVMFITCPMPHKEKSQMEI